MKALSYYCQKRKYLLLFTIICSFCTTCTFFMHYDACQEYTLETNNKLYLYIYCVLEEMKNAFSPSGISLSLGMIGFLFFYFWFFSHPEYHVKIKFKRSISLLFSFFSVTGTILLNEIHWKSSGQLVKMFFAFLGAYFFYSTIIQILYIILQKDYNISLRFIPKKIKKVFWKSPGVATFITLLFSWAIPIILKYPAGICTDVAKQLNQGLGYTTLTAHHPIFHTMLMTWFVKLGRHFDSANLGIFFFCIVEAIILAAIFGFIISIFVKLSTSKWILVLSILFFAFSPYITGYIGTPIKDLYFVTMVCLYIITLFVYSVKPNMFWTEYKFPALFVLSSVGMALFRNNGIHICLLTGILILINEIVMHKKNFLFHSAIVLFSVILAFSSTKIINSIYDPLPGSIREVLSIPIQQTARYVSQYGEEITKEEKTVINKLLPYDELPKLYDPYISDPVKRYYNDKANKEDIKEYLKVWFHQFKKHPDCYIKATYQQNIFLLYPQYNNYAYYLNTDTFKYANTSIEDINTPDVLKKIQVIYRQTLDLSHDFPILNIVNNMAAYIMLLIILSAFIINKKQYSHLLYFFPLFISILIIIAGPTIHHHVRYAFPIIYTFPIWLAGFTTKGL